MRFGELLATSPSEATVEAMRRRFLSAPTSLRPRPAPWPRCSLARSPKSGARASRRTWPRTPWLESHQPPEAEIPFRSASARDRATGGRATSVASRSVHSESGTPAHAAVFSSLRVSRSTQRSNSRGYTQIADIGLDQTPHLGFRTARQCQVGQVNGPAKRFRAPLQAWQFAIDDPQSS